MSALLEKVTEDALSLSDQERASLIKTLLLSVEHIEEDGVEEAWDAEISKRLERIPSGKAQGYPADEVIKEIRSRYCTGSAGMSV